MTKNIQMYSKFLANFKNIQEALSTMEIVYFCLFVSYLENYTYLIKNLILELLNHHFNLNILDIFKKITLFIFGNQKAYCLILIFIDF